MTAYKQVYTIRRRYSHELLSEHSTKTAARAAKTPTTYISVEMRETQGAVK